MKPNQYEKSKFLAWLRERGMRVTAERMAVFDEIFAQHRHVDTEELLRALRAAGREVSRATVYRNLDLLVEAGFVRKYRLGRNHFLWEHVHAGQHHEHLICSECGRVVEFVSPAIAALQTEICRAHGFVPRHHNLQIFGWCQDCVAREQRNPSGTASA